MNSSVRRREAAVLTTSALLVLGLATPASAATVDDLLGTVSGVVDGVDPSLSVTVAGESLVGTPAKGAGKSRWILQNGTTSLDHVAQVIGADKLRLRSVDGEGVGVALIDTGVAPVAGLTSGNVVNGPDLSFESQSPAHAYLDGFGHGTHMAGIIAGNEPSGLLDPGLTGIAPGARLTSVKVGSTEGAVDVSQVVAAVDWVVAHRDDDPLNPIRVLNLSYGTDGVQDHQLDPLTHAVENAWRAGIVVVAAGGNSGTVQPRLNNPAYDPYVLAVGAADTRGTRRTSDDLVAPFSSVGDAARRVDVVAPGTSLVSLRVPGSYVDEAYPSARVNDRYLKGSGSSQAAAVVSGAVALLLDARPELTPDQVKSLLRSTTAAMPQADADARGAGEIDVWKAASTKAPTPAQAAQTWPVSTGLGSLEQARGSQHVAMDGVELVGEQHVLGAFDAAAWAPRSAAFSAWSDGTWAGGELTGGCWCTDTWSGKSWTGKSWTGKSWTSDGWTGTSWTGKSWTGKSWTGAAGDDAR